MHTFTLALLLEKHSPCLTKRDKLGWLQRPIPGDLVQTAARTGLAQATFFHTDCCTLPSHSQRTKRHCNNAKTTVARPKNHGTFSRHCLYCVQAYNTQAIDITPSQSFRNLLIPAQVRQKHHEISRLLAGLRRGVLEASII